MAHEPRDDAKSFSRIAPAIRAYRAIAARLATSWMPQVLLAVLLAVCLPLTLFWLQQRRAQELPASVNYVPADADWFILSDTIKDLTTLSGTHLAYMRSALDDSGGWPTNGGIGSQEQLDQSIDALLVGDSPRGYKSLHCLLSRDDETLKQNGLDISGSTAMFRKDNRLYFLLPATKPLSLINYLSAGLVDPVPTISIGYWARETAGPLHRRASLNISADGYQPCLSLPPGTDAIDQLTINGMFTAESDQMLNIELVPIISSGLKEASVRPMCKLRGKTTLKCQCELMVAGSAVACQDRNSLPLPRTALDDKEADLFESGLPASFGGYTGQKLDNYVVLSAYVGDQGKASLARRLDRPSTSIGHDGAFKDAVTSLRAQNRDHVTLLGGIRPTSGMRLQKNPRLPAIPLYLTTPLAISMNKDELIVSLIVNLAPQDMELLKLIALKPGEQQAVEWSGPPGSGIQISFNDPSLRSYPKLLNTIFPDLTGMLQAKGRVYPLFFDLLDNGISAVSFASLKKTSDWLAPVAIVTSHAKSDLAGVSRLLEVLSRHDTLRRNAAIMSGLGSYLTMACTLASASGKDCFTKMIERRAQQANRDKTLDEAAAIKATLSELSCTRGENTPELEEFVDAVAAQDLPAFDRLMASHPPDFKRESSIGFTKRIGAMEFPGELSWGSALAGMTASVAAMSKEKLARFNQLLAPTIEDRETGGLISKSSEQIKADLRSAAALLQQARHDWGYLLDGDQMNVMRAQIDEAIKLWGDAMTDDIDKVSAMQETAETLAAWAPAQNDNNGGLLEWFVSLPTIDEIGAPCASAKLDKMKPVLEGQQLQVDSVDMSGSNFALIFYQRGNSKLIRELERAMSTKPSTSKFNAAVDGSTFLSKEESIQNALTEMRTNIPYRLMTISLNGQEDGKGIAATLSLKRETSKQ